MIFEEKLMDFNISPETIQATYEESFYNVQIEIPYGYSRWFDTEYMRNTDVHNLDWIEFEAPTPSKLFVHIYPNYTDSIRTCDYTIMLFSSSQGVLESTLTVAQSAGNAITITGSLSGTGDAGSTSVVLSSDFGNEWLVTTSQNWLTSSISTNGGNSSTCTFFYETNTGSTRTAEVEFTNTVVGVSETRTFTQSGGGVPPTAVTTYTFSLVPNSATVSHPAGSFTSEAVEIVNVTGVGISSVSGNMSATATYDSVGKKIVISYSGNDSGGILSKTITLSGQTPSSGVAYISFTLYQTTFDLESIWKDDEITYQTEDTYIDYEIKIGDFLAYKGRAYRFPNEDSIVINLSRTVELYMENDFFWRTGSQYAPGWCRTFDVYINGSFLGSWTYIKDYSYKDISSLPSISKVSILNDPIINELPSSAYVPLCYFNKGVDSAEVKILMNGTTRATATIYDNNQYRYLIPAGENMTYGIGVGNNSIYTYKGVKSCKYPYVLYYENAYGGIDALPVEGKVLRSDAITNNNMSRKSNNTTIGFEQRSYMRSISPEWELNTSWLTDSQSEKMHHLLESAMVYLYDVQQNSLKPVVITSTSLDWKTYKNQGNKLYNYKINIKESKTRVRR